MSSHYLTHKWLPINGFYVSKNWKLNVNRIIILKYQQNKVNSDYETKAVNIQIKTTTLEFEHEVQVVCNSIIVLTLNLINSHFRNISFISVNGQLKYR